jgi:hypothetical protein
MEPIARAFLLPHSHWDREWYEPFEVFRLKLRDMLDTVLNMLASEAAFTHFHLDGQTVMIEDYLVMRPERFEQVAEYVRTGRLSIGPFYTLTDEFLVSGESIIRNLEKGLAQAATFGVHTPVDGPWAGYMPDQFGHIGQFPQILQMFDIDRAVILRGAPASLDRSTFMWRSPDGSEVLTEYLIHGYFVGADIASELAGVDPDYHDLATAIDLVGSVSDRNIVLVPVGADHWTPEKGMFDTAIAIADANGLNVEITSLAHFLSAAEPPRPMKTWTGELRAASTWILLPNTVATRTHQKRRRGQMEALIERYAEPLAALVPGMKWPQENFDAIWRLMLLNAGHDCAYGASADSVATDIDSRFDEAETRTRSIIDAAMHTLAAASTRSGVLRWNPSPFEREGVPGLGWTVQPASSIPAAASVRLEMRADHLLLPDGTSIFFTDEDDDGDLFTFCPVEDGKPRLPDSIEATSASEVRVKFTDVSVDVTARRRSDEKFTRLSLRVVNSRENHRLRLWFELPSSPEHTTALSPFEVVRRPLIGEGFESEIGSATWPARGAVLAASTAVFSEGVVEYEVDRNRLGVTLLRAAGILAKPTLATRPIWAGPPTPTPGGQCLGTYDIELAILTDASKDQLHDEWERFALPLLEIPTAGGGGEIPRSMLNVAGAHLSAVRRVATGVEVRVWNEHSEPCVTVVNGHSLEVRGAGIATIILEH